MNSFAFRDKWLLPFVLAFVFSTNSSFGQKSIYIGLLPSYGFSYGGTDHSDANLTANSSYYSSYTYTFKYNPINVGQGFTSALQIGLLFSKNFGVDLSIGYLLGSPLTLSDSQTGGNSSYIRQSAISANPTLSVSKTSVYKISSLYFAPSLVAQLPLGKVKPYLKSGIFLGVLNSLNYTQDYVQNISTGYNYHLSESNTGGLAFGISGILGLEFQLKENLGIFTEFFVRYASYSPEKFTSTRTFDTPSFDTQYSGSYKDEISISYNSNGGDRNRMSIPMNAIGASVGLRYYIPLK